jgi:predicted TPR repeat methyltransferase
MSTSQEASAPVETVADDADALLRRAMSAHDAGEFAAARIDYERLLALAPDHPDGLHLFGLLECMVGNNERAVELIGRALALLPGEAMFHNNIGLAYAHLGRLAEAEEHYRQAFELDSGRLDAVNNLALLKMRQGKLETAEQILLVLLETAPAYVDARHNLAGLYLRQGQITAAVEQCRAGLITAPKHPALRRVLGFGYTALGDHTGAIKLYGRWLAEEPDNAEARHHYAALTGTDVPLRCSDDYVRSMFDTFASTFEHKLAQLDYAAPSLVGEMVRRLHGEPRGQLRVADAGCGTGLCAPFLKPYASRLVGVDLSKPMLERAIARQAYDELVQGDLTAFLLERPQGFDLLVSADTLCYFGALEGFAAAARASLAAGGWLVFSVEAHTAEVDAAGWRLQPIGRYSHQREYVLDALFAAGFVEQDAEAVILRQEAFVPVQGWLVRARVPPRS